MVFCVRSTPHAMKADFSRLDARDCTERHRQRGFLGRLGVSSHQRSVPAHTCRSVRRPRPQRDPVCSNRALYRRLAHMLPCQQLPRALDRTRNARHWRRRRRRDEPDHHDRRDPAALSTQVQRSISGGLGIGDDHRPNHRRRHCREDDLALVVLS